MYADLAGDFAYLKSLGKVQIEKLPVIIKDSPSQAAQIIAERIVTILLHKQTQGKKMVLGCATGSSPIPVYNALIKKHKQGVSFHNLITINLDEYSGLQPQNPKSYCFFMKKHFISKIDMDPGNFHILPGIFDPSKTQDICREYQNLIQNCGGIDFQILGIGRSGHIGFNQPKSTIHSLTRLVKLCQITRKDAQDSFGGLQHVPTHALTMGIRTILSAKEIVLIAWTQSKQYIVKRLVEQQMNNEVTSTYLHTHGNCTIYLDTASSNSLSRFSQPWKISGVFNQLKARDFWEFKAIVWLSQVCDRSIMRLRYSDFVNYQLESVIKNRGNSLKSTCQWAYKYVQSKITLNIKPSQEGRLKIVIFSPHPDDDVICMGGTIKLLQQLNHQIYLVQQTSGNFAVFNHQAFKFVDVFREFAKSLGIGKLPQTFKLYDQIQNTLLTNTQNDCSRLIKKLIRRSEARIANHCLGVPISHVFHLDMPFYETGSSKKGEISQQDLTLIKLLLNNIQPDVIFAAGDLSDPHGTHRICLMAIINVIKQFQKEELDWFKKIKIYLYRGSWQEWQIQQASLIIPLNPVDVQMKKKSILRHQSQKDPPMFPGNDPRQFWQRALQRNRQTAVQLSKIGLPDAQAYEVFVDYQFLQNFL